MYKYYKTFKLSIIIYYKKKVSDLQFAGRF